MRRPLIAGQAVTRISPAWWLAGIVFASFVSLAAGSRAVGHPSVFVDELIYSGAAERLAGGHDPAVRGAEYGYGVVYPLFIAPLYALFEHVPDAYAAVKVVNAALFSIAAVPAYFLARRVCRPGLALGVALLTVLLPARAYAYLVLTESLAFLLFLLAALAIVRALERPTAKRQLVVLALAAVAVETRRQNLVLVAAIPLAILLASWLEERDVRRALGAARRYAVTWGVLLGAALLVITVSLAQGQGVGERLGPYEVLLHGYEAGTVVTWLKNHVAALGLTFAVLPLVALPFGLSASLRPRAPAPRRSLGVVTLVLVTLTVVQVGVFSSTVFGLGRVHERYLFYVAPLTFAMLALWIEHGVPRPNAALVVTCVAVVAMPFLLPIDDAQPGGIDSPTLSTFGYGPSGDDLYGFHAIAVIWSAFLALWLFVLRPRQAAALIAVVALALGIVDVRFHQAIVDEARAIKQTATGGPGPRDWIDRTVGKEAAVTAVAVGPDATCPTASPDRLRSSAAFQQAAFFNTGIVRVVTLDNPPDVGLPVSEAHLTPAGVLETGRQPGSSSLALADARLRLRGRRVARDVGGRLALWLVELPLRLAEPGNAAAVRRRLCSGRPPR